MPIAHWSLVQEKYEPAEPWRVEIRVAPELHDALRSLVSSHAPTFRLEGATDTGVPVTIPEVRWSSHQMFAGVVTGRTSSVALGQRSLQKPPEKQWVVIHLTATPLARDRYSLLSQSFTGEILARDPPRIPLGFASHLGRFDIEGHYGFEEAIVGGQKALVRVALPTLMLIPSAGPHSETGKLADTVAGDLSGVLRALSILSRTPVNWTRIAVISIGEEQVETILYGTAVRTSGAVPDQPLLEVDRLPHDAIGTMVEAFRVSAYRDAIQTAAGPLVAFFAPNFIEENLSNAFTAFETLVQGIDEVDGTANTIPKPKFKKLRRALSVVLDLQADSLGLSDEQRRAIESKLPELERRPIVPRAIACIERFGVDWADLWPRGTNLADALAAAFRIRNGVVHTGALGDVDTAAEAADRIHALAERLAFRLLNGDSSWLSWRAYYHIYALTGEYPHRS